MKMQIKNIEFHSAPSSPKQSKSPIGHSRPNSTLDEFEFGTSCRFNLNDVDFDLEDRTEKQNKKIMQIEDESLPVMAFADELFSDGKVLPLPPRLKIPPSHERLNENHSGKSSTVSSPRSPLSALKIKFVHQNLWNDEFDPFLVALQSVKKDGAGKAQANSDGPDPAHSTFTPRPNNSSEQMMGLILSHRQPNSKNGSIESPKMFLEPKGLAFARAVVNMDLETGSGFNRLTMSGPILKSNGNRKDGRRFSPWKRNKLRKVLSLFGKLGLKFARSAT
ncbi:hypothetical protein E6C27_scaffold212G001370 [Cucumis melo var. makuwa]|uniref:Uncharacterized protein n=1 Tax=Cucumis melo var. makuwa TaxID=1194695 RepID=A0A5A7V7W2_CUCMM|nr:hypothetical protein E6C27_scaffold212G001370 [Cucumis melo var. makuwa]